MIAILLAVQAATVPQRFSVLAPPPCGARDAHGDIVVCGNTGVPARLPPPDEEAPPPAGAANKDLSGARALALQATPCGAKMGCMAYGPSLLSRGAAALVKAAGHATPARSDRRGRVAIPLDAAPSAGRLLP